MKKRIRNKKKNQLRTSRKREPKRTYRDTLFRTIFGGKDERSKRWLLSLYNQMCLYEHQSTVNPNMPLRGLLYFSQLYQQYIDKNKKNLYGSVLVKIPAPQFIVFYNGDTEQADLVKYRNKNHNESLSKNCEPLYYYCEFVNQVKENLSQGMPFDSAVNEAVDFAIKSDFLEGFFREKRMKILDDIYTEFDQESYDETLRNDGRIENAIANAKNFLALNKLSEEEIARCCSLPLEQVLALKEELAHKTVTVTN